MFLRQSLIVFTKRPTSDVLDLVADVVVEAVVMNQQDDAQIKALIEQAIKDHAQTAFPNGDAHGHRRAHDMLINDFRARQKMKEDTLAKIVTGVAWAIVVGVGYAIWLAIKAQVQK